MYVCTALFLSLLALAGGAAVPTVKSIDRHIPFSASTGASNLLFRVLFDQSVSGVDVGDFQLTTTGTASGVVQSVTATSGQVFYVRVTGITGLGTLRLDLKSGTDVINGSSEAATGFTSGQVYTRVFSLTAAGWGRNNFGQLGNGLISDAANPVSVDISILGTRFFVATAYGAQDSMGITSDGRIYAWGTNASGQLGNGNNSQAITPGQVHTTSAVAGKNIIAGSVGNTFMLALGDDGKVYSWGDNSYGQLGLGHSLFANTNRPVAVSFSGALSGKTVVSVAAGYNHALVLTSDGQVFAWGTNNVGQLGIGTLAITSTNGATAVSGLSGKVVIAIGTGGNHNFALTAEGELYAWGQNTGGQLGDNSSTDRSSPVLVTLTALAGKTIQSVGGGFQHSAALTTDGLVYTWGTNSAGQLGDNTTTSRLTPVAVYTSGLLAGKQISEIGVGSNHVAVLSTEGFVYTWGTNNAGQLGNGQATSFKSTVPVAVTTSGVLANRKVVGLGSGGAMPSQAGVLSISTTPSIFAISATDGSFKAGQTLTFTVVFDRSVTVTGNPTLSVNIGGTVRTATYATGSGTVTLQFIYTVQAGDNDTDGVQILSPVNLSGGTIQADSVNATLTFTQPTTPNVLVDTTLPAISAIKRHIPADAKTGARRVVFRAEFNDKMLGLTAAAFDPVFTGTAKGTIESITPDGSQAFYITVGSITGSGTVSLNFKDGVTGITDIAGNALPIGGLIGGQAYTLTSNVLALGWGYNASDALGTGLPAFNSTNAIVPVMSSGALAGKSVVSVVSGNNHSVALTSDGKLYAWGSNSSGQLGTGSATLASTNAPVEVSLADSVIAIVAGANHTVALTANGKVYAWGANNAGQLGIGTGTTPIYTPTEIVTTGALAGKRIVGIGSGTFTSFAVTSDGLVYSWGSNTSSVLGIKSSSPTSINAPTAVYAAEALAGKVVVEVTAANNFAFARTLDGLVYAWGDNFSGQLGANGVTTQVFGSSLTNAPTILNMTGALAGKKVLSVAGANAHAVALADDGIIYSWGFNNSGRLGLGSDSPSQTNAPTAVYAAGALTGKTITSIAAYEYNSAALTDDGQVFTWGVNSFGQLGLGVSNPPSYTNAPAPIKLSGVFAGLTFQNLPADTVRAERTFALASVPDPTITSVEVPADAIYKSGAVLTFAVNFSSAVTVSGTPRIPLTVGASPFFATYDSASSTGTRLVFKWTVTAGANDSDGIDAASAIQLNGGSIVSIRGSAPLNLTVPSLANVLVDNTIPSVVSIVRLTPTGSNFTGSSVVYRVTFSENVSGVDLSDFKLTASAYTGGTIVSVSAVDAKTYDVTVNNIVGLGNLRLDLKTTGTSIQDTAGNDIATTGYTAGDSYNISNAITPLSWGNNVSSLDANSFGQLGSGSTNSRTVPGLVFTNGALSGKTIVAMANGTDHTLALTADGLVYAWGYNGSGQLGIGSNVSTNAPTPVVTSGALSGKTVIAIAAGGQHSMALTSDGKVFTWGKNNLGQLGNNTFNDTNAPASIYNSAAAITGKTVIAIAAGLNQCYVLTSLKEIISWGDNSSGQLASNIGGSSINVPVFVDGSNSGYPQRDHNVIAIAAGGYHGIALTSDGTLYGWGANTNGQIGMLATTIDSINFVQPVVLNGALSGKKIIGIAAGGAHTLAVSDDGKVFAWGANFAGQLGNNSNTDAKTPVAVDVTGALNGKFVTAVAGGLSHSTAVLSDGSVVSWGSNTNGQLGNNSFTNSNVPQAVSTTGVLNGGRVFLLGTSVVANHTTAFLNGVPTDVTPPVVLSLTRLTPSVQNTSATSVTFRIVFNDEVTGLDAADFVLALTGTASGTISNIKAISSSVYDVTITVTGSGNLRLDLANTATIQDGSGNAITTGYHTGDGYVVSDVTAPVVVTSNRQNPSTNVVSGGTSVTYRVTFSEAVTGVSTSAFTVTGSGTASGAIDSVSVVSSSVYDVTVINLGGNGTVRLDLKAGGTGVQDVSANATVAGFTGGQTYRVVSPGVPFSWGSNLAVSFAVGGQLGNSVGAYRPVAQQVVTTGALAGKAVVSLADGQDFSLALTDTGEVYAWGSNFYGVLGNGLATSGSSTNAPTRVGGALIGKAVVAIAAGGLHCMALTSDGQIYVWGDNTYGVLGTGNNSAAKTPVLAKMDGALAGKTVVGIAAGLNHSLALTSDGRVFGWGQNTFAQLGNNLTSNTNAPSAVVTSGVLNGKTVVSIGAGATHSIVLTADGKLYGWGDNTHQQLGNNTLGNAIYPVPYDVVTTGVLAGKTIVGLSVGYQHTMVWDSNGNAYGWGANDYGQLGNNATSSGTSLAVAVYQGGVLSGKQIAQISAGNSFTFAVTTDGVAYAWGKNDSGQLGNNDFNSQSVPVPVLVNDVLQGRKIIGLSTSSVASHALVLADGLSGDVTAPQVQSITRWSPASETANTSGVIYHVTFSEDVLGVDASDFVVTKTGSTGGTVSSVSVPLTGDPYVFEVTVTGLAGEGGTVRLDLKSSGTGIRDCTGNALADGGFTTGEVYGVDRVAPTVSIGAPSKTVVFTGSGTVDTVSYPITISGADLQAFNGKVTLNKTSTANGTVSVTSNSVTSATVTISSITGAGTLGIRLAAGAVLDNAGNGSAATANSTTFTVKALGAPTISGTTVPENTGTAAININRNAANGSEVAYYRITAVTNGKLYSDSGFSNELIVGSYLASAGTATPVYFRPNADFHGTASFGVRASTDDVGTLLSTSTTTCNITVTSAASTPSVASPTIAEDTVTGAINITRNATDGTEVTRYKITGITNGKLYSNSGYSTEITSGTFITSAGTITAVYFRPATNFYGSAGFSVRASLNATDAGLGGNVVSSVITVNPVADTPTVESLAINEDADSRGIEIVRNENDGAEVTYFKITAISNGTLYADGAFTVELTNNAFFASTGVTNLVYFRPAANFFGTAGFTVQASVAGDDTGLGGTAVASTITVASVADTPTVASLAVNEDTASGAINITRNAADGNEVTHYKVAAISHGKLYLDAGYSTEIANDSFISSAGMTTAVYFRPDANFYGSAGFSVQASLSNTDAGLGDAAATSVITVNPVADTPTVKSFTLKEDKDSGPIQIVRNEADGNEVTHFKITAITNGKLYADAVYSLEITNNQFYVSTGATNLVYFRPADHAFGTAGFTVQASLTDNDAGLGGDPVSSVITISPVAGKPSVPNVTIYEDTDNTIVITRNPNDGAEVTHYKAGDIVNGKLYADSGYTVEVLSGSFITSAGVTTPVYFRPNPDFFGVAIFSVRASIGNTDAGVGGGSALSVITIKPVADTPSISHLTINEDSVGGTIQIIRNATDRAEVTHYKITAIRHGKLYADPDHLVEINNNSFIASGGAVTPVYFRPATNFAGTACFAVQASLKSANDGLGGDVVTATITVSPVNDTPSAGTDSYTTDEDTVLDIAAPGLMSNDSDVDAGDILSVVPASFISDLGAKVIICADGRFKYDPTVSTNLQALVEGDSVVDSFRYTLKDQTGASVQGTVNITVNGVNDAPTVALLTPTNHATFVIPVDIALTVATGDVDGTVVRVVFLDVDSGTIGISSNAPFSLIWSNVNVTEGVHTIKAIAMDELGATTESEAIEITVIKNPPATPLAPVESSSPTAIQSGLFTQVLRVENPSAQTLTAIRVTVQNLAAGVSIYNASGTNSASEPFLQHNFPVPPFGYVDFTIEYYIPGRTNIATPTFLIEVVTAEIPTVTGTMRSALFVPPYFLSDGNLVLNLGLQTDKTYAIQYSSDLINWNTVLPLLHPTESNSQWIDDGPPKTQTSPKSVPMRFYRVIELE